jgi:hypothetical protein
MELPKTKRNTVVRAPKRAVYEREQIHAILDEALVCHVGFATADEGRPPQPFVIPTAYGREGDRLFLHGAAASRMMRALAGKIPVCVTVTLLDGLVLARSAFHHSVNYRSVVIFGEAEIITDEREKDRALRAFTEHIVRGRWDNVRPPTAGELKATTVLALPIDEASAKVRTGPPVDDEEDYALNVWAGVLPCRLAFDEAVGDERLAPDIAVPDHVRNYRRQSIRARS